MHLYHWTVLISLKLLIKSLTSAFNKNCTFMVSVALYCFGSSVSLLSDTSAQYAMETSPKGQRSLLVSQRALFWGLCFLQCISLTYHQTSIVALGYLLMTFYCRFRQWTLYMIRKSRMTRAVSRNGSQCGRWNLTPRNAMCVSLKREPSLAKFYFCGKLLEYANSHPYLEVEIDNRLRWKENINHICNTANNVRLN